MMLSSDCKLCDSAAMLSRKLRRIDSSVSEQSSPVPAQRVPKSRDCAMPLSGHRDCQWQWPPSHWQAGARLGGPPSGGEARRSWTGVRSGQPGQVSGQVCYSASWTGVGTARHWQRRVPLRGASDRDWSLPARPAGGGATLPVAGAGTGSRLPVPLGTWPAAAADSEPGDSDLAAT